MLERIITALLVPLVTKLLDIFLPIIRDRIAVHRKESKDASVDAAIADALDRVRDGKAREQQATDNASRVQSSSSGSTDLGK